MVKLPTPESWKFDKRTLEKKKGPVTKDVKSHLDSLVDDSGNVEMVPVWDEKLELPSKRLARRLNQGQVS